MLAARLLMGACGGAGGGSEPPTITNKQHEWWADDLALSDTDPVTTWTDRINSLAITNTGSNRPVYRSSGINSLPAVDFSGSGQWLAASASSAIQNNTTGVWVAVVEHDAIGSNQSVWQLSNSAAVSPLLMGWSWSTSGQWLSIYEQLTGGSGTDIGRGTTTNCSAATPYAYEWSSSGTAYALRVDNTTQSLSFSTGSNNGDWGDGSHSISFAVGARTLSGGPDLFFNGKIAYLMYASSELSSGDRTSLYGWISSYYGV